MEEHDYEVRCHALEFAQILCPDDARVLIESAELIEAYLLNKEERKNVD